MHRSLAIALASSLALVASAFGQSAPPVLIGQEAPLGVGQADPATAGQDAMAQDPNTGLFGPGGPSPLLIVGGVILGAGVIVYAATQNQNNAVSP